MALEFLSDGRRKREEPRETKGSFRDDSAFLPRSLVRASMCSRLVIFKKFAPQRFAIHVARDATRASVLFERNAKAS